MSVGLESAARLASLKSGIEAKTGESHATLTDGVNALIAGFGSGGGSDLSASVVDGTLTEYINPNLTGIRAYAFYKYAGLQKFIARNCTSPCTVNSLRDCSSLTLVDASFDSLQSTSIANCPLLKTIILRKKERICGLANVNALGSTPFASGGTGGTVYVPSALVESYKTATNWVTLYEAGTCNFAAIEGSEYE